MKKFVLVLIAAVFLFSCNKEDSMLIPDVQMESDVNLKSGKSKLGLEFSGLSPLGADYRYEGWLIVDGMPVSTGKFNITPAGVMAPRVFNVNRRYLSEATTFVLTIEPQPDRDPAPSDVHVLGGDFSEGNADLTISHAAALGTDFASAMGNYILATPTTSTMEDELSGIWFLDINIMDGTPMPKIGLDLPTLPAGWIYEGWTVIDGVPVTSGKFMAADMKDYFDGFSSMENSGPPFPGEDYVLNAPGGLSFPTDLSGGVAVISVEPYPDNSEAPFAIKPLLGGIPIDATDHMTYMMDLNPGSFPTGTAMK